jgi:hypothetical protein
MLQYLPITRVRGNPKNPRVVKDERFHKLVQSVKDFPEMLELRPIVVDADFMVLGGNMRLKACQAAGLTEIPVLIADSLTEAQKKEFVIKDNVSTGTFSWSTFFDTGDDWDVHELQDWGLELPYSPNIDPSFSRDEVTDKDIATADQKLTTKFNDRQELREVTCPHCGEDFGIDQ